MSYQEWVEQFVKPNVIAKDVIVDHGQAFCVAWTSEKVKSEVDLFLKRMWDELIDDYVEFAKT